MSSSSSLTISRVLPAPRDRVYAMWTSQELMKKWFCPGPEMSVPVAEVDAREGGSFRIVMENKDGETHSPSGVYETVVPNEKLVFSWKWADSELITRVTIEFNAVSDNETELTLIHDGFPETDIRDRHTEGWEGCLSRLTSAV